MADRAAGMGGGSDKNGGVREVKGPSVEDPELDNLLEEALHDFDKPTVLSQVQDMSSHSTVVEPAIDAATGGKGSDGPPASDVQAMESLLLSLMSGNSSDLESRIGNLNIGADAGGEGDADFAETLQRTLGNLVQSTQDLQNQDFSEESLMKLMTETLSGGDAEGAGGEDEFMPMMQGMMRNLLSKDILYPSLKDISTKYPQWLETNRDQLPKEELDRYERQSQMMATIISEFEAELPTDPEEVKHHRFERVLEVMQQMQELGQPPKELVGDPPTDFELDEDGFPKMPMPPFGGGMPSAEQCRLM